MHGLKSAILTIFQKWQNGTFYSLGVIKKIFLFWHRMNSSKAWSVELEVGIFWLSKNQYRQCAKYNS